jgi:hypothetical protein
MLAAVHGKFPQVVSSVVAGQQTFPQICTLHLITQLILYICPDSLLIDSPWVIDMCLERNISLMPVTRIRK